MDSKFDVVLVGAGPVGILTGSSPGDVAVARLADTDMGNAGMYELGHRAKRLRHATAGQRSGGSGSSGASL